MSWVTLFRFLDDAPLMQANVVGVAWIQAAQSGNEALVSNLLDNHDGPAGICLALDEYGIPVPAPLIPKHTETNH